MIYENCSVWPSRKRQGEWGELRFMAAALAHGFNVMRPWGDSSAYDVVVERGSHFLRIQVKSTSTWAYISRRHQDKPVYLFMTHRNSGERYFSADIDFYALYVIPEDLWFIVPPRALRGKPNAYLCPGVPDYRPGRRFEKYREAWHLLGDIRETKDPHGLVLQGLEPNTQWKKSPGSPPISK